MRDLIGQLKAIDLKSIDLRGMDTKRIGTATATLVVALGAGYYMQNMQADTPVDHALAPAPVQTASVLPGIAPEPTAPAQEAAKDVAPEALPEVAKAQIADATEAPPAEITIDSIDLAALDVTTAPAPISVTPAPVEVDQCAPVLMGNAGEMATISLKVTAPCHGNSEIEFSHAGLQFSEYLDANGEVSIEVPAMMVDAKIAARLADGASAEIELTVPDAAQYHRAALVWQGATGLQLHAFEEGADYGETGHVWADHPGGQSRTTAGKGGYVTVLGSVAKGYAADIYTFPAYMMRSVSGPDISIEAQVMETTCDQQIQGTFLRANGSDQPRALSVQMAAPGCDAVGEYLVLQDMPRDLKIALN